MIRGLVGRVLALFAPGTKGTLTRSQSPGGRRMLRYTVPLAALLLLVGLGLGLYTILFPPPALHDAPAFAGVSGELAPAEKFEQLAKTDPVEMLAECLTRYQREVKGGITATLIKKERPKGEPEPPKEPPEEVIKLYVRGDVYTGAGVKPPVEVLMKWQSGYRTAALSEVHGAFYSDRPKPPGTGGKLMTWRPKALISTMTVAANDPMAQDSSRYCIRDAGLYRGMQRTYEAWKDRKQAGTLQFEYLGRKVVEKAGGRECYVVRRTCKTPEVDAFELGGDPDLTPGNVAKVGFTSVTIMIDVERWLQVGSELHRTGPDGKQILIGSYYFRDIDLHPEFAPDTFTEAGLKRK